MGGVESGLPGCDPLTGPVHGFAWRLCVLYHPHHPSNPPPPTRMLLLETPLVLLPISVLGAKKRALHTVGAQ